MNAKTTTAQIRLNRVSPAYWRMTFNNPPLNVMGPQFVQEFREVVTAIEDDEQVKVVVFDSAVEGYFLNHSDFLANFDDLKRIPAGPTGLEAWPDGLVRLTRAPVVSIALIRGRATGNGSEIALASDMTFVSREKAVLSQWEVGIGLVAGGGPMARLPRLIGRGRALEVLLSSEDIGGELAEAYGYVNRALPDAELDGFVDALATRIAGFEKWAIANTKRLVNASLPPDVEIAAGWDACMASVGRPATQARIRLFLNWVFTSRERPKIASAPIWAASDADPRCAFFKGRDHGLTCSRKDDRRPRRSSRITCRAGCRFHHRYARQHDPAAPHERCAGLLARDLRAESLHLGPGGDANGRPAAARAARPGSFPSDGARWRPLLRDGRRCAG